MEQYIGWLIGAAIVVGLAIVGVRSLAPRVIGTWTRLLLPADQKAVFDHKTKLLENTHIVEFVAPAVDFQREYGEDEKRRKPVAWLTPWPNAVKASWKKHKGSARYVDVRAQLRAAAHEIVVSVLPDERQPANASDDHFFVLVPLGNRSEEDVMKLKGLIKAKLGLHCVEAGLADGNLDVEFVCHAVKPAARLETMHLNESFYSEHPALTADSLPMAQAEDGEIWCLNTAHTLVYGITGAGKGSVLKSTVFQLAPFIQSGTVELHIIDPKSQDFVAYRDTTLAKQVATRTEDAIELIERFYALYLQRKEADEAAIDVANGVLAKSNSYDEGYKMMVLLIDELYILIKRLSKTKRGIAAKGLLDELVAESRSRFIYIIAATQISSKEVLEEMSPNFVNRIALSSETSYWSDKALFTGAAEKGWDASLIPISTKADGYRTAGIAYVRKQVSGPLEAVQVRFANPSDDAERALLKRYAKSRTRSSEHAAPEPIVLTPAMNRPASIQPLATPTPVQSAPRSQVDELIAVKEFSDAKLAVARERVAAKLAQGDSVKGRALLDAIDAELRIRARLAQYAPAKPQPLDGALPPLNF